MARAATKKITVRVRRYNDSGSTRPRYDAFKVPLEEGMSVLNVLNYIYENLDPTLAYYYSCRIGKCTGCHVRVNGKVRLICTELATGNLTLDPLPNYKVIRDLVVDRSRREDPKIR